MVQDVWPSLDKNHTRISYWQKILTLFPGLPTVQFLMAYKNGEGRPDPFYHMNDVNVSQVVRRGEESLTEKMSWKPFVVAPLQTLDFQMFTRRKACQSNFGRRNSLVPRLSPRPDTK